MADDPNQLGGTLQDRVAAVIHSVAALHALQDQGQGQQQAGAPQQPQDPMAAQQSALHGMAPPQPQQPAIQNPYSPQPATPAGQQPQPQYSAPSTMGQRGPLPQGVTMQRAAPTAEFPGGITRYNGVYPPSGQQQGGGSQQAQQAPPGAPQVPKMPPLGPPPPPITPQETLSRMNKLGLDTADPAVQHLVPAYQEHFNKLGMADYAIQMKLRNDAAQIQQHLAGAQLAATKAEQLKQVAMHGGGPEAMQAAKRAQQARITIDQATKNIIASYQMPSSGEAGMAAKKIREQENKRIAEANKQLQLGGDAATGAGEAGQSETPLE